MICGESCVVQDTKSNSMRNKVLGEHLIFLRFFPGGGVLKIIPLIEGIYSRAQKDMVFRVNWAVSDIKSPSEMICSGIQV